MKTINPTELTERLSKENAVTLIDVLPDTHYENVHIVGAKNACIYEVDFLEKVKALQPDKSQPITVYGLSDSFQAAPTAVQSLNEAGYENVTLLAGGIQAWIEIGNPLEGENKLPVAPDGDFDCDTEKSDVRWTGRNLFNRHHGTVAISKSSITLEKGHLTAASLTLDMRKIVCDDITDSKLHKVLIDHLSSADFFLVEQNPEASFELEAAIHTPNATPGSPNFTLSGTITLRGKKSPFTFHAALGWDAEAISLQGRFDLDRVTWGSTYGSGKIFEALGQHIVNDLVSINFQLRFPR